MKSQILSHLTRLPALGGNNAALGAVACKICGSRALMFDLVDFNKTCFHDYYPYGFSGVPVVYYKCQRCSCIFTNFFDDWSNEDFANFIYNSDYPLVDGEYASVRPERIAAEMAGFLRDHRSARILDYGAGTGAFAERLKAAGFAEVHNYDPFSNPGRPSGQFDIITCFETIEHSPFPNNIMADLLSFMKPDGCVIFSTGVQPSNINELRANWWYIAPRNGHVSIYTLAALELLGARVGLQLYSGGGGLAFAGPAPSPRLVPLLRAIGPRMMFAALTAPDDLLPVDDRTAEAKTRGTDWHAIEGSGPTRFRWTSTDRIEWMLNKQPANSPWKLIVTIPFLSEIVPGFADRCVVEIGSRAYPVHVEAGAITAVAECDQPLRQPVALVTPGPLRPSDLRTTTDGRALGLAVPLAARLD